MKTDNRIIAREEKADLDEEVRFLETKGWEMDTEAEPNPYQPNPSCPPWPTVLMTRPTDHPEAIKDLRAEVIKLRNHNGSMTGRFNALLKIYRVLARLIENAAGFTNRGGKFQPQIAEDLWNKAKKLIEDNREHFGPRRMK
jgi:hypothetical protein